jgi:glycogen debranching enzyme
MPVQLTVGPPVLTIDQDITFMVTDLNGEIAPDTEQGVFSAGTRFISRYRITANGRPWTRLTSSATAYNEARVYLTNPAIVTEDGDIPAGTVALTITRAALRYAIAEDLEVTNYGLEPIHFHLELDLESDFADLFDVKDHRFVPRGQIDTVFDPTTRQVRTTYSNREFRRAMTIQTVKATGPVARYVNGRFTWEIKLDPGASWHLGTQVLLDVEQIERPSLIRPDSVDKEVDIERLQREWQQQATKLESSNDDLAQAYRQSVEDLGGLRMFSYDMGPDVWVPAAGVPWFVTVFGRDSLVVSMQSLIVSAQFAPGALRELAKYQATTVDDWRDAQPGKILHEIRQGELAFLNKLPYTPYYGTWDATPLFLITLHAAWKWLGDVSLLRNYRQVVLGCLEWIDKYGDLDGDGFQEYQTFSSRGYENMGWKDAVDAVVYPDGSQVKQPKALCELQGYVFDGWLCVAEIFDTLGEPDRAAELRRKTADLQRRFEETFWCEDLGFYAYGLDPEKKPIKTIASNPGHCLWSGIASPEHAARVVKRFFEPDMWSGWGIRTLSTRNPAYNPYSYQNGSVWPHDNGIAALGFSRYGYREEAGRVAADVLAAASYFTSYRLPELYAGVPRQPRGFPVQYLGANVPQAWAAGCVFHFVQAMLGIQADAPNNRLTVDPHLPEWLPDVTLRGLKIGGSIVDLRFWREADRSRWETLARQGSVQIEQAAWRPWVIGSATRRA